MVTFIITLVVIALITYIITSLYYKYELKEFKKIIVDNDKNENKKNYPYDNNDANPAYETVSTIKMDTNPAYGTASTIKMDSNPAYTSTNF